MWKTLNTYEKIDRRYRSNTGLPSREFDISELEKILHDKDSIGISSWLFNNIREVEPFKLFHDATNFTVENVLWEFFSSAEIHRAAFKYSSNQLLEFGSYFESALKSLNIDILLEPNNATLQVNQLFNCLRIIFCSWGLHSVQGLLGLVESNWDLPITQLAVVGITYSLSWLLSNIFKHLSTNSRFSTVYLSHLQPIYVRALKWASNYLGSMKKQYTPKSSLTCDQMVVYRKPIALNVREEIRLTMLARTSALNDCANVGSNINLNPSFSFQRSSFREIANHIALGAKTQTTSIYLKVMLPLIGGTSAFAFCVFTGATANLALTAGFAWFNFIFSLVSGNRLEFLSQLMRLLKDPFKIMLKPIIESTNLPRNIKDMVDAILK